MLTLFRGGTLVVKICIDITALTELVWWMRRKRISSAAMRSLTCLEDKEPFFFFSFFLFLFVAFEWAGVLSPPTFANPLLRNSIGWFCCRVERQVVAKQTGRCTPFYLRVCKVSGGTSLWTACGSCRLQWCTRTSAFPARRLFLPTYPCTHSEHRFPAPSKDVVWPLYCVRLLILLHRHSPMQLTGYWIPTAYRQLLQSTWLFCPPMTSFVYL